MDYRHLAARELDRALFAGFVRRQTVTKCRRREQDAWVIRDDPFIDDWSEEDYRELLDHLKAILRAGGFVYAGFCRGVLKGFVAVDPQGLTISRDYLDLAHIYVSADLRGRGVGRALFEAAVRWAGAHGAKKLYISAHSAVESQAFYRAMGCVDAEVYDPGHVEKEPFDCQMEYVIPV